MEAQPQTNSLGMHYQYIINKYVLGYLIHGIGEHMSAADCGRHCLAQIALQLHSTNYIELDIIYC
jgi:hypothetical protein